MEFCHLKTAEVMNVLRNYMIEHPNCQHSEKLQKIMEEYVEHPASFSWMHVFVKGYISTWRLGKGALFVLSSQDEDSCPNKVYVEEKWLTAYKHIRLENLDLKLIPLISVNTVRDFIDMVYQECV